MHYYGGKGRWVKTLVPVILSSSAGRSTYVEPFLGGAVVASAVAPRFAGRKVVSDINRSLITMWRESVAGWEPPDEVSEEQYYRFKATPDASDPLTDFALIGLSFAGRWGDWYRATGRPEKAREVTQDIKRAVIRRARALKGVEFYDCDYRDLSVPPGALVYCDPPYVGTDRYRGYPDFPPFDHDAFWDWARRLTRRDCLVLVSERIAPPDFSAITNRTVQYRFRRTEGDSHYGSERLFVHTSQIAAVSGSYAPLIERAEAQAARV